MVKTEQGQVMIIVGVLLVVILLFLGVLIDGARLFIKKQEINRVLDTAGKAGLIVAGDRMVTQVISAQTAAAAATPHPTSYNSTLDPSPTKTSAPDDFFAWLTKADHQTLVAPPMQTIVATHALGSLDKNGLGQENPDLIDVSIIYPYQYNPGDQTLIILMKLDYRAAVIFGKILDLNQGVLSVSSKQTIPLR